MGLNLGSIGKKIEDILGAGVGAVGHEIGQLPNQILHLGAPAPVAPAQPPQPTQIPRTLGPQSLGLSPTLYNPNNMPSSLMLPPPAPLPPTKSKNQIRQGILANVAGSPIVNAESQLADKTLTTPISGKVLNTLTGSKTPVSAKEVINQIPAAGGSQVGGITGASEYYRHVQNIQALHDQLLQTDNPDDQNAIKAQIHKEVTGAATSVPRALIRLATFPVTAGENLGGAAYAQATGKPSVKLPFVGEVPSFSQQVQHEGAGVTAANALVNLGAVAGGLKAAHGAVEGALPGATEAYHANPTLSSEAGHVGLPGATPDELAMGKSLGMTPEQVTEAKTTMDNPKLEGSSTEPAANKKALETATEQADAYNARLATAKNNPLYGQVGVPTVAEGDTARALQNPSTAQRMVVDPANEVLRQGSKLSEPDKQLLDLVKTTPRETILSRAENPIRVGKTLDALKHYNDTTHALGTSLDQKLGYKENYGARQFFDIPKEDITKETSTYNGSLAPYGLERKYVDYAQGGEKGLTRLHSNILQDVAHDAAIRARTLSERALQQGLEQAHPGEVVDVTQTSIPRGWKQLRIPSGENLAMPQELADQINKRAIPDKAGLIGQAYDSATKAGKTLAVGGNPFHGITEAFRFTGQQLLSPDALSHPIETLKAHARVFAGTFSKAAAEEASAGYEADGTRQWSRIGGQTLDKRAIAGDASMKWYDTANKANPIRAIHDAVFGREIPLQKQEIMRQAMQGSTDYTNPEMIAKARQVALATNHMFGGLDHSTDGFSPTMAKRLSRISFSGDYTEAKGRLLQDALTRADKQGNIARQAVIGKALVAATPGVIALSVAGKINWNDPKDVAKKIAGQIIDPSLPTSFKTASGIAKVALTPNSDVSELARVIEPFFNGDPNKLSGIEHWAVGRVNPVISPVVKLVTNQDYKGDPIWKHRVDAQGNDLGVDYLGTAKNLATGSLTSIGTNLAKVAEGKQSLAEAGVNMAGFRTAADQNDPRMKAMNFQSNLIKSQPKQLQIDYGATHPQRTDANGVVVQDRSFLDSASKAAAFLDNPKLLALDQQIADKNKALGLPTDPFYSLKPDQQKVVLNLTNDRGFNAGDPVIKRQTDDNPWLAKFYADRSAYYDSQNIKPDTVNPTDIPAPIADKPTQALLTQMDSLDGAGRAKLIQDNPMLSDFLAKNEQYTRDKRAALGKPQYDQYPVASPGVQKTLDAYNLLPKNTGERSAWIRSHPQEYVAMSAYLSKASLYNLEQSAGQAAFEGQSLDQKGLKAVSSLGQYDIVKNPDGTLALKYGDIGGGALPQPGAVSAVTSGGSVSGGKSSAQASFERRELRNAGKSIRRRAPRVKVRSHSQSLLVNRAKPKKAFVAFYPTAGKRTFKGSRPKVSLKPSR